MSNRIDSALRQSREGGKPFVAPYLTIGFPTVEASIEIAVAVAEAGADLIELGVPFSDPLADGPTIQKTSFAALRNGVTVKVCLDVVREIRGRGVEVPLVPFGYYNPFLRYGTEAFARDAAQAGADGIIVPDLPFEESGPFAEICAGQGLYIIPLLAPTSTDERIVQACKDIGGFIYCVSVTGVTGARDRLQAGVEALVARIRAHTTLPILVGFGISTHSDVLAVTRFADGVVVGSALLNAVDLAPNGEAAKTAGRFVAELKG